MHLANLLYFKTYTQNPVTNYFKWLFSKALYEIRFRKMRLRVGYMSQLSKCTFGKYVNIGPGVSIDNSFIDSFSYTSFNCVISSAQIGKFCSIGPNVIIAPGRHPTHTFVSTHPAIYKCQGGLVKSFVSETIFKYKREVIIGHDVWIGANAVIGDGVTIGSGAIIGANTVVNKDVEPYSIIVGTPPQFVRKRFSDDEIEALLKFSWWNKSEHWIEKNIQHFWNIKEMKTII